MPGRFERDREGVVDGIFDARLAAALERDPVDCRHLARDAGDAQAIAAVRRQGNVDDAIVEREILTDRRADGRIVGEFEDADRLLGELEFRRRTDHAARLDPADLRLLDLEPGQAGADARERDLESGAHVGRTADHAVTVAAVVDLADAQLVGIGMSVRADDAGDDDAVECRARRAQALDLVAGHRQLVR